MIRFPQPVPAFNFYVYLFDANRSQPEDAGLFGAFAEVSGLNAELDIEEYREGGRNEGPRRFAKWGRYPNIVFKRGVTFNTDLWDWHYKCTHGDGALPRKNGLILLNDSVDVESASVLGRSATIPVPSAEVARWYFSNGVPERLVGPSLNAKGNEIAIETLEISHEWLARLGPGMNPGGVGEAPSTEGI